MDIESTFLHGDALNVAQAEAVAQRVKALPFQNAAKTFAESIKQINHLLALPFYLVIHFQRRHEETIASFDVLLGDINNTLEIAKGGGDRKRVDDLLRARLEQFSTDELIRRGQADYRQILEHMSSIRSGVFDLQRSAVVWAWTAFEVFVTDVWVATVNTVPHFAWKGISKQSDQQQSSKMISIHLLAKYRFDLRHRLGSALRQRFRFKNVDAICDAYATAFPKMGIENVFQSSSLLFLEATRHVIVHQAGRADDEYRRRTHSSVPEGELVPLTLADIRTWVNTTIAVADQLLAILTVSLEEHASNHATPQSVV